MATNAVEFIADEPVDFVPDEAPAATIDFVPDEVVAQEAERATQGAKQALGVMQRIGAADWSGANEQLDTQRLQEARTAEARAKLAEEQGSGTGPGSEAFAWRREADFQRGNISPFTAAGQTLEREGEAQLRGINDTTSPDQQATPSEMLSGILGPGLSSTAQPVIESAGRNLGGATGGAIGAALGTAATVGSGGAFPLIYGLGGALIGSHFGGLGQEAVLSATETPEETQNRQRLAAEAAAANPKSNLIGGMVATAPFFGPSLAQFGRAASGDMGALANLGIAGGIGAGTEAISARIRGEKAKPEDLAAAFFTNLIMGEPTRLGRMLGFHPSSEQAALEAAQKYEGQSIPIGRGRDLNLESGLMTRPTSSTADIFARVQRQPGEPNAQQISETGTPDGGVRAPEITGKNEPLPAPEGGEGVQPSGQREPLAPNAPEASREVAPEISTAIRLPDGTPLKGEAPDQSHAELTPKALEAVDPNAQTDYTPKTEDLGFAVKNPDGTETFVDRTQAMTLAKEQGIVPADHPATELTSEILKENPPAPPTAARASEAPSDLPGATSNKEAVVNAERAARELDPIIKEAKITNAESIDRAQQVIAENPLKPQEIVERLRTNPQERTISLEDSAVLLVERTKLNAQRDALLDRAVDENLSPTERATAKSEFEAIETRLNELDQAAQDARSTWGRFGQLWQRSMRRDFSLEALTRKARLQKGEALTPEESAQVKKIADDVAAKQTEADAAVTKAEAQQTEKGVDEAIKQSAAQPEVEPAVKSLADRIIAKLDARAEAARARLREKFKRTSSGVDPTILADFVDLAVSAISKTAIKSGQWISNMVKEWGEESRPYLQAAWDKADGQLDKVVESATGDKKSRVKAKAKILSAGEKQDRISSAIAARVKEGESLDSLGRYVDKLVDSFVAGGVRDRNALVAAVKGALEPVAPGITDRKVGELISGYGQATQLSKDPLKVIKRDLKGQLQQVSKLEALAAKEPLKKTGPERRTQSDEERRLIKRVNEAKKAAGVETTDPATQLKSTLDSTRTRLSNEIKDLTFQIDTGERPPNKTPVEYTQEIEVLRGLRDRMKEVLNALDGPRELTEEQRIKITTRGLLDSIAAIERRIAGEQPKMRRAAPDTPEIRALKAKREALRQEMNELNEADSLLRENRKAESLVRSIEQTEALLNGTATRPAPQQGPESQLVSEAREQLAAVREQLQAKKDADPIEQQRRMDAAEAAVEKSIKKLDEQLADGDLSVQRAPTPAKSQRLEDLRLQRDAMNRLRNQLRAETRPRPNPLDAAIKARKSALLRQEADYQARIARGDFAPRTRKPPLDLSSSPEALDALARVQTAKDQFTKLQKEWELKSRTRTEKIIGGIKQTWDALRNLKLSFDLSAPLQTAKAMASHPIHAGIAVAKGARAFAEQFLRNTDTYAKRVEQQIVNSPNNKNGIYKQMKLDLSEVTGAKREENAGSILERLADLEARWQDIPDFAKGLIGMNGQQLVKGAKGIAKVAPKLLGMGIKASNAGFGAIANYMRARTADSMLARHTRRRGAPTKAQLELYGNEVNSATGKGGLRGEEGIRALLFAPNYYLSIIKQLTFQPVVKALVKHEGAAAREILEEYVRAAATVTSIGVLQYLFGNRDKQTLDPRSPNFARAMTDKGTSLDFTMGRGAYATLAAQAITGERIGRKGKVEKQDRMQAFLTFLKGRLSREISTGLTTAAGTDFKGKPIDKAQLAQELVSPLSWQDIDDVLKREGLTRGSFIQMLNILGVTHRLAD